MDQKQIKPAVPFRVLLESIVLGLLIELPLLTESAEVLWSPLQRITQVLICLAVACCVIWEVIGQHWQPKGRGWYALALVLVFISAYWVTVFTKDNPSVPFISLVFVLVAFLLPQCMHVDERILIKTILLVPIVLSPGLVVLCQLPVEQDLDWLSISYDMLPPIIASAVYMRFYYGKEQGAAKIISLIGCFVSCVLLVICMFRGARGPFVSVLLCVALLWVIRCDSSDTVTIQWKRLVPLVLICTLCVLVFEPLVVWLGGVLNDNGVHLTIVDKCVTAIGKGDVTNGRAEIWPVAWQGFMQHPLWGNGIDQLDNMTGLGHPHNFILQTLYDGGMLLFVLLIIPVVIGLVRRWQAKEMALWIFLVFVSIPASLLSHDMWGNMRLWLLFGYALSMDFVFRQDYESDIVRRPISILRVAASAVVLISLFAFAAWGCRDAHYHLSSPGRGDEKGEHSSPLVIVYVGQGMCADHCQAYGYERKTNPYWVEDSQLIRFDSVYATQAERLCVSQAASLQGSGKSVALLSRRAVSLDALQVMHNCTYHYCEIPFRSQAERTDSVLLNQVQQAVEKDCQVIFAEALGCHLRYSECYPDMRAPFLPAYHPCECFLSRDGLMAERYLNTYDNAIWYQDLVQHYLITYLQTLHRPVMLVFVSETGTSSNQHVPAFVWYSNEYAASYPEHTAALKASASICLSPYEMVLNVTL